MAADRILTTHVGSLIRPPELVAYLKPLLDNRPYDEAAFEKCLKSSVAEVVRRQAAIGLDLISDGEFGKTHWYRYAIERFSGIQSRPVGPNQTYFIGKDRERFREFYAEYDKGIPRASLEWAVTSTLSYRGAKAMRRDIENFKAALAQGERRRRIPAGGGAGERDAGAQKRILRQSGGIRLRARRGAA